MTDSRITLDSSKRGGRPCIRNLRISVYDVLEMLADGMSEADIIEDFPRDRIRRHSRLPRLRGRS